MERIRETVIESLSAVLRNAGRDAPETILDTHTLADELRIDSLDFAVVVVDLERRLGMDPFRQTGGSIRTVGELIQRYQQHSTDNA